ncbi:MAG TPA: DUF6677 family protein [Bryobacteraceae bacterium]|jgi:hypothetical protein|nr:DUF6677 family protein [Bryobacteraceae bacterium]
MAQTTTAAAPGDTAKPVSALIWPVVAAWIIPGGGHFLQRRLGRGALLLASVGLMFVFGLLMRGMMFMPEKGDVLTTLINYGGFICDIASGALYFVATVVGGYAAPDLPGDVHDYGTKFLVTAGLLNILAMVDAYEIASGKKD